MRKMMLLLSVLATLAMLPSAVVANGKGPSYRHFDHRPSVQVRVGHGKRVHVERRLGRGHRIRHIRSGDRFGPMRYLVHKHRIGHTHGVRRGGLHQPGRVHVRRDHRPYAVVHWLSPRRGIVQRNVVGHHDGLEILKGGRPATVIISSRPIGRKHLHRY